MRVLKHCVWFLTLFFSLRLLAQSGGETMHRVEVHLRTHCSDAPDEIDVIVGARDDDPFAISRDKTSPCTWIGTKPDDPLTMNDKLSLRFKGARTDCRKPQYQPGDLANPEPIAKLTFRYKPQSASAWKVTTEGNFHVFYQRKFPADTERGGFDCAEAADFLQSDTIYSVAYPVETVQMRFGDKSDSPWVTIDDVLRPRKRIIIEPYDIGYAHVRQTMSHGIKQCEIDAVAAQLLAKGLKKVTLEETE
jgi:hypothetical protein